LARVLVTCRWPTTSLKVCGLHFLYRDICSINLPPSQRLRTCWTPDNKVTVHPPSTRVDVILPGSQLQPGCSTAHERFCLPLLPPGPDGVHKFSLRGTQPSTPLTAAASPPPKDLRWEFGPALADCGLQGTASSPPSTVWISIRQRGAARIEIRLHPPKPHYQPWDIISRILDRSSGLPGARAGKKAGCGQGDRFPAGNAPLRPGPTWGIAASSPSKRVSIKTALPQS
jgi:hypothetical protein